MSSKVEDSKTTSQESIFGEAGHKDSSGRPTDGIHLRGDKGTEVFTQAYMLFSICTASEAMGHATNSIGPSAVTVAVALTPALEGAGEAREAEEEAVAAKEEVREEVRRAKQLSPTSLKGRGISGKRGHIAPDRCRFLSPFSAAVG